MHLVGNKVKKYFDFCIEWHCYNGVLSPNTHIMKNICNKDKHEHYPGPWLQTATVKRHIQVQNNFYQIYYDIHIELKIESISVTKY